MPKRLLLGAFNAGRGVDRKIAAGIGRRYIGATLLQPHNLTILWVGRRRALVQVSRPGISWVDRVRLSDGRVEQTLLVRRGELPEDLVYRVIVDADLTEVEEDVDRTLREMDREETDYDDGEEG